MNNFVPLRTVLSEASFAIEKTAHELSLLSQSSRLDDPDARTRLLLSELANSRRELAQRMRNYSQLTSPNTLNTYVQFAPEMSVDTVADGIHRARTSEEALHQIRAVDTTLTSELERLSEADQPPIAQEVCEKVAAAIMEHQRMSSMMCQTAQDC